MKKAFTLIELLVVIAIIALLAAILFPVFSRVREKARQTSCASNMKQLGLATMQYIQDFDETFPFSYLDSTGQDWRDVLSPYTKSKQLFSCPSNLNNKINSATGYPVSYAPNTTDSAAAPLNGIFGYSDVWSIRAPAKLSELADTAQIIAIAETNWVNADFQPGNAYYHGSNGPAGATQAIALFAGHQGRTNYVFVDGHVKPLLPFGTVAPTENGTATLNMWRRDGQPYQDVGCCDLGATNAPQVFSLANNYYSH